MGAPSEFMPLQPQVQSFETLCMLVALLEATLPGCTLLNPGKRADLQHKVDGIREWI